MSTPPIVSIIIPVYNAEPYLRQCLDSILQQDIEPIEIIAVNDGSTDQSAFILEQYRLKYGIVVVSQPNGGASRARNTALDMAHGKYVGFVDADDWVEPRMYSTMCEAAERENADIVFCNIYRNYDEQMQKYLPSSVYRGRDIVDSIYPQLISSTLENENKVTLRGSTWCRIFRRDMLKQNDIRYDENLIYNEDGLFCIRATLAAQCYIYLGDDYLYHNRYVAGSLTKRYIPQLWERQKNMYDKLYLAVTDVDYDFSHQIDKKLMEIAIYSIENECKDSNSVTPKEIRKHIKNILKDEKLQLSLKNIRVGSLKRINKAYWWAIRLKSPWLAKKVALYRQNKHKSNTP